MNTTAGSKRSTFHKLSHFVDIRLIRNEQRKCIQEAGWKRVILRRALKPHPQQPSAPARDDKGKLNCMNGLGDTNRPQLTLWSKAFQLHTVGSCTLLDHFEQRNPVGIPIGSSRAPGK